jgi:hypothetical protein
VSDACQIHASCAFCACLRAVRVPSCCKIDALLSVLFICLFVCMSDVGGSVNHSVFACLYFVRGCCPIAIARRTFAISAKRHVRASTENVHLVAAIANCYVNNQGVEALSTPGGDNSRGVLSAAGTHDVQQSVWGEDILFISWFVN